MSITWAGLPDAIEPGEIMYLANGSVRLRATAVRAGDHEVETEVEVGGSVASRQGLNIPGPSANVLPAIPARTSSICGSARRSASTSSR